MNTLLIGPFQRSVLEAVNALGSLAYGMRIRAHVEQGQEREVHMSQVYSALSRLESLGVVESTLDKKNSAGRHGKTRRVYRVVAHGQEILRDGDCRSQSARHEALKIETGATTQTA